MAKLVHNVQKKQHRERSQTQGREKFGLLEKKKDYRLRAADYHKKQAAIKALRAKAATHNPDEYYHAMTRSRTDDRGVLIADRGNEALSTDQVKLLKTQDVNYVRTMRLQERSKLDKQRETLAFQATGKHTVFVDSAEEQAAFEPEKYFDTDADLLGRRQNRLRKAQLEGRVTEVTREQSVKPLKVAKRRMERESQLRQVEDRMNTTRELMKKGDKKKVSGPNGDSFKWKNQRKR